MPTLAQSLLATLEEELAIIKALIDDAHLLRQALNDRDGETVHQLVARRQTSITRLQIVQHAKTTILKKKTSEQVNKRNVRELILQLVPDASSGILEELRDALVLLYQLNTINDRLLSKHKTSLYSYNHLIDMALGVEQTYNPKGTVNSNRQTVHLEQHG